MPSTTLADPAAKPAPSVRQQIIRATAGTLGAALALGLVVAVYSYSGPTPLAQFWWRVAGDPDVVLAEGVVLPDQPPAAVEPVVAGPEGGISDAVRELGPVLGGPAVLTSAKAGLLAQAPFAEGLVVMEPETLRAPVAVASWGALRIDPWTPDSIARVWLVGSPDAPRARTLDDQRALVTALVKASLTAAGTTAAVSVDAIPLPSDGGLWTIELVMPGCDVCRVWTSGLVAFAADGRLRTASLPFVAITGVRPIAVPSALEAFEAVRHHRGDGYVEPLGAPITSAELVVADIGSVVTDGAGTPVPMRTWQLLDENGVVIGAVPLS